MSEPITEVELSEFEVADVAASDVRSLVEELRATRAKLAASEAELAMRLKQVENCELVNADIGEKLAASKTEAERLKHQLQGAHDSLREHMLMVKEAQEEAERLRTQNVTLKNDVDALNRTCIEEQQETERLRKEAHYRGQDDFDRGYCPSCDADTLCGEPDGAITHKSDCGIAAAIKVGS